MNTKSNLLSNISNLGDKLATAEGPQIRMLDLAQIETQAQVRTEFDEVKLQELAEDIKARGVQQPVKVRPLDGGRFLLVFGERRLRASRIAGLPRIPAIVQQVEDDEADDIQFIENIQREDLSLADESAAIARRYEKLKLRGETAPLDAIAGLLKKSKGWVSKRLSVATKLTVTKDLLEEGVSQDVELLLALEKLYSIDSRAFFEQVRALRSGKANRESVRKALDDAKAKADKAKAEKKAAKKAEKKAPQEPKGPPPFDVDDELWQCVCDGVTIAGQLEKWGEEGRAKVEAALRPHWDAGKAAAAKGPAGMIPELMRWYVATSSYDHKPTEFRSYLAGAAGEAFDLEAILTDTRKAEEEQ